MRQERDEPKRRKTHISAWRGHYVQKVCQERSWIVNRHGTPWDSTFLERQTNYWSSHPRQHWPSLQEAHPKPRHQIHLHLKASLVHHKATSIPTPVPNNIQQPAKARLLHISTTTQEVLQEQVKAGMAGSIREWCILLHEEEESNELWWWNKSAVEIKRKVGVEGSRAKLVEY